MIIKSILDNDLYKFSMSYAYWRYPEAEGEFVFLDRNNTKYTAEFVSNLKKEINGLAALQLTQKEFEWCCKNIKYIPANYWEWLQGWRPDPNLIKIKLDSNNHLHISVKDKMYKLTWYEVPILAIVSELQAKMFGYKAINKVILNKLDKKIALSNKYQLKFSEFGTRRRFNFDVQELVVQQLVKKAKYFVGTSNVYLAMKCKTKAIGTFAHEAVMFHAAIFGYRMANYLTLEWWAKVYDGSLGIALTDTLTSDVFFKNFSKKQAKLFDGLRHDSGNVYQYIDKAVKRYKALGVDPMTKVIIFSNALTMPEFKKIADACKNKIQCSAGIGTNLSNDTGNKAANIVMKLSKCRMSEREDWHKCLKISDDKGKFSGDKSEFEIACKVLKI